MDPTQIDPTQIDCKTACVDGCVLGDRCPNREYQEQASKFIQETSLDDMLSIADEAIRKKMMAPPQWVFPDEGVQQD
ncbi:MAG: hypothetical protein Kow00121_09720 [Elainellaceae cyanobacterium]